MTNKEPKALEVYVSKVFFPKQGVDHDGYGFGIYSLEPVNKRDLPEHVKLSKYGNFSAKGEGIILQQNKKYKVLIGKTIPSESERYDDAYEYLGIETPSLSTPEEQNTYLTYVLTKKDYEVFQNAYSNHKEAYPLPMDFIHSPDFYVGKVKHLGETRFERIKKQTVSTQDKALLIVELEKYGFSTTRIDSILEYYNHIPMRAIEDIRHNIYNLTKIKGWGFKTVDKAVIDNNIPHDKNERLKSALRYTLMEHVNKGNVYMPKEQIITEVGDLTEDSYTDIVEQIEKDHTLITIDGDKLAIEYFYEQEKSLLFHLERLSNNAIPIPDVAIDSAIKLAEEEQGFTFTDEQLQAIQYAHKYGVSLIIGSAGTGKSATVNGIAKTTPHEQYRACALSGRAVDVLKDKGVERSATIHREFQLHVPFSEEFEPPCLNTVEEPDLVIFDEFSMIDVGLYVDALERIETGVRIVLVGDSGQLPSIGVGDVARDLTATKHYPVTQLTKIHRQALESGIIEIAYMVRNQEQLAEANISQTVVHKQYGVNKDANVFLFQERNHVVQALYKVLEAFKNKHYHSPEDMLKLQVVTPMKLRGDISVYTINTLMQDMFNPESKDKKQLKVTRSGVEIVFRQGDKVMAVGNTYSAPMLDKFTFKSISTETDVFNGTMGIIRAVDPTTNTIIVDYPREEGYVVYGEKEIKSLDLAYCATVHKMQGSSAENVIMLLDYSAYTMLSKQLLYVGITRAELKFTLLAEASALHRAISTDASESRNTFLPRFIRESKEV